MGESDELIGLFGDALSEVDKAVDTLVGEAGHITAKLGLAANTLILFASDNGPSIRWGLAAGSGKMVMLSRFVRCPSR